MNDASSNGSTATDLYVFDTFAFLALFRGQQGDQRVGSILADGRSDVRVSAINAGEVYYVLLRDEGTDAARRAEEALFQQSRVTIMEATWSRIRAAATLKAGGGISYADAFAAALAQELSAPLVTGDHEFERLERSGAIRVIWLR